MKTAEEILHANKCGDIFSRGSKEEITVQYRALARAYHPDLYHQPDANEIAAKLNILYETAIRLVERGAWEASNLFEVRDTTGRRYQTIYLQAVPFELGVTFIADQSVTYLIDGKHRQFYENACKHIRALQYPSKEMEKEIARYMPDIRYAFETNEGMYCLILRKDPEILPLEKILQFYKGSVPARHVAWMISRLCNLCCYFDFLGITHNGLSIENCFVSPQNHTLFLWGGWWCAQRQGEPLLGVPRAVYEVMPVKTKGDRVARISTDLEALKSLGCQLLSRDGVTQVPSAFRDFLNSGSMDNAADVFSCWNRALQNAYGKRTFVEMNIRKQDIYRSI